MKTVRESTTLYNFLGSHNPYWRLTESSDVLRFSTTETTEPERTLQLSAEQAARIREMTVITSSLMMSLTVDESDLSVHLVGRKINKREWAGNASAWHDTPAVARDLSHGLSFAEQVVSEAHSAIVILDSRGNIQRFNRLCEDYTGLNEHAINQADNNKVGVVYLDLDNFKKVNDAYGHLFGDQLLRDVSLAILSCLEHDQVLARPGGDEFLVLASNTSQSALEAMASRILTRLRLPFRIGLIEVYTSCSVGIALSPEHGSDSAAIIRHADTAMYTAKEGGRGQFCVFTPEMNQRVFEYLWLDTNLRKALENDQLVIHYQPKITWRGEVRSLEALVRWQSPERGLIPPLDFISYAEESGLIVPLGRWVILDVVRQVAKWRDKGINLRVAVNISARQLADQTIFTALKQVLQELNFEYCPIDVELTESCLIENDELALSVIQQFSQLGAQVHLDDFGTAYSSLSQLARFPIDAIKLDQVFVRDIHKQPVSQSLVRAIVAVAQALNLQVIAEGVESAKEDAFLTKNGINERQGFLFAKPMPAVAFERWYKRYLKRA
ncbi:cyclic di-GMP phosphodiesterase [Escherichia coli]|uniref:cyclic di-GMP phosphodiesterase n=1 Tax=Escherichia coli TaxID=562 RepID=UPI000BDE74B1|nr:cyclic di-GMP phosphodiesterase [Escherichia coli]EHP4754460.1 cyclic di-GMP phosphodiesterase [Escherichia coli]